MGSLWSSFRDGTLRPLLKDTGTAPKWADAELLGYANLAIDDLSAIVPALRSATVTGCDGSTSQFPLPDDLIKIDALILDGVVLDQYEAEPGRILPGQHQTILFVVDWPDEGLFSLTKPPRANATLNLVYSAWRAHLAADDAALPTGRNRWMEQAIAFYACMLAHLREGVSTANLEQWKTRQDLRVGNPLNVEAREWYLQYQRVVRENRDRDGTLRTYVSEPGRHPTGLPTQSLTRT